MKSTLLLSILLIALSCASDKKKKVSNNSVQKQNKKSVAFLTKKEAIKRKEKVSHVSYDLNLNLTIEDKFAGNVMIEFDLKKSDEDLRIDFNRGKILKILVNDQTEEVKYNNISLTISPKHLKKGYNKIQIDFTHSYSKDGSGLYRFVDQEDKRVYIYSDLEPYDANRIFPSFDQPNLKAHYKMQVKTPRRWVVSTYAMETKVVNKGRNLIWHFPRSQKFSTYIWSLHAGEYAVVVDKKAKYPSRLFMRKSLKKYVKISDWQVFTRQSFDFLDDYFGISYPYLKYDQLIVPDFNAGAMENVAAVTFSERYVSRGEKTQKARRRLANVIFHEMAHMWFGNLVTMDWWNDLWLNESFATYIANLGVSRATEFTEVAFRDFNRTKQWAYWEDQSVTTHPIVTKVPDTNQAFANFDGITYGKGASSLKQIHYYLGEESFKKGLRIYFRRYATINTSLNDFIGALGEGAGIVLDDWKEKWLESTGVNRIKVENHICEQDLLKSLTLSQSKSSGNTVRPHSFEMAFLKQQGQKLNVYETTKVKFSGESLVLDKFKNVPCPDVIYPNFNDYDYISIDLDSKSLKHLEENINGVSDSFLRQMLWTELWTMVYYGRYSYKKFYKMALNAIKTESDPVILDRILNVTSSEDRGARRLAFYDTSLSETQRKKMNNDLYDIVKKRLLSAKAGSESQKVFYSTLFSLTEEKGHLDYLIDLMSGRKTIQGFKIDQDKRWGIISLLNRYDHPLKTKLLEREKRKDKSSRAKKAAIAIEAMTPDLVIKNKWLSLYKKNDKTYSFSELKQAMYNLFPIEQKSLKEKIFDDFMENLMVINLNQEPHIASTYARVIPTTCSKSHSIKLKEYLDINEDELIAGVLKNIKIGKQENDRCLKSIEAAK